MNFRPPKSGSKVAKSAFLAKNDNFFIFKDRELKFFIEYVALQDNHFLFLKVEIGPKIKKLAIEQKSHLLLKKSNFS